MDLRNSSPSKESALHREVALAGLALLVLVALMAASYFYPYPSGKRPDLLRLLMFWGREALIVASALVLLVVLAVGAIVKAVRKEKSPNA